MLTRIQNIIIELFNIFNNTSLVFVCLMDLIERRKYTGSRAT